MHPKNSLRLKREERSKNVRNVPGKTQLIMLATERGTGNMYGKQASNTTARVNVEEEKHFNIPYLISSSVRCSGKKRKSAC